MRKEGREKSEEGYFGFYIPFNTCIAHERCLTKERRRSDTES